MYVREVVSNYLLLYLCVIISILVIKTLIPVQKHKDIIVEVCIYGTHVSTGIDQHPK